ncbi:hypothetical protein FNV43_RR04505 [Rhamnella rubrinervis]|uniref:Ubiquitin-like protease family profile domain-containing protein n=1 Tax=Rhamnella rubrinervis TaxID=2594499 RepID=A0A8K0MQB2_9ROSA|nr:hypothetical protein FNV43_RR04505 [Rhamnella rubrinervis]
MIIADCLVWATMQGRYTKYEQMGPDVNEDMEQYKHDIDWANELNDSPFNSYYARKMSIGSWPLANINTVYMLINNSCEHWIVAKVDIQNRHVTLYDPSNKMTQVWFQLKNARVLVVLFSYLLMVYGYYNLYPELMTDGILNLRSFTISHKEDSSLPQ